MGAGSSSSDELLTSTMSKPLVSVLVPVYNVEDYLPACIESLLNQTMDGLELIFVDDVSTDGSLEILKRYQASYPDRIRIVELKEKGYLGGARNAGIKAARADYIGFCDSDDVANPRLFEELYRKAVATEADLTLVQFAAVPSNFQLGDEEETELDPVTKWDSDLLSWEGKTLPKSGVCDAIAYEKGGVYCWLIKRQIVVENELWLPPFRYEDNFFLSLCPAYVRSIAFIPEILYYWRQRQGSTMHSKNEKYHIADRAKVERYLLDEVRKRNLLDTYYDAWEYIYTYRYAANTAEIAFSLYDDVPYSEIKRIAIDLDRTFPRWRKNRYWKRVRSLRSRVAVRIILACPRFAHWLIKIVRR